MSKQSSYQQATIQLPPQSPYPDTSLFPRRLAKLISSRGGVYTRGALRIANEVATALLDIKQEDRPGLGQVMTLVVLDDVNYAVVPFGHKVIALGTHNDWKLFVGDTLPMHLTIPTLNEDNDQMLDHDKRDDRREAMIKAFEFHKDAKNVFSLVNLSVAYQEHYEDMDHQAFWYFLREVIESAEHQGLIDRVHNIDAHTFCRMVREVLESANIYDRLNDKTVEVRLKIYKANPRHLSRLLAGKPKVEVVQMGVKWELLITDLNEEKENAQS